MRREWFGQVLQSALLSVAAGVPRDGSDRTGLTMVAERRGDARRWAAAFVARPGKVLDPTGETPDVVGADLDEVLDQLLARQGA